MLFVAHKIGGHYMDGQTYLIAIYFMIHNCIIVTFH